MTAAQEKAINTLKDAFFKHYCYGRPEDYEFKCIQIDEWTDTKTVYIALVMGLIGDEGTLAEVFGRDRTAVCIGPRGGYFSFRESSCKQCNLNLYEAVTWGFKIEQQRKRKLKKKQGA